VLPDAVRYHWDNARFFSGTLLALLTPDAWAQRRFCNVHARHRHRFVAKGMIMLHYAVVFFVIALIAALFGFGGIAAGAAEIAKVLFFIFLVLFVVSLIVGLFRRT
jgi:uncharacterized membrane protein YtjA (UPF0391 family)